MIVANVLAALVGLLLVFTSFLKFREGREALASSIAAFKLLPRAIVLPVAALLPPVEMAIGVCMVAFGPGVWQWLGVGLLVVYTAAVVSVIVRGIATDCGCFGSLLRQQASWVVVARNSALIILVIPACVYSLASPSTTWYGWAILAAGSVAGIARLLPLQREPKTDEKDAGSGSLDEYSASATNTNGGGK